MSNGKVIESKFWQHVSGRTASIYGSVPWTHPADKPNWTMVSRGFTIRWDDGTVGTGRPPFATEDEAHAYLERMAAKGIKGGFSMMTM